MTTERGEGRMKRITIGLLMFLTPMTALAAGTSTVTVALDPNAPVDLGFIAALVKSLTEAYQGGAWPVVAGLVLTALVAGLRMFEVGKKVPAAFVPWVACGVAVLGTIAVGLQLGQSWSAIAATGLSVGLASVGGWETLGKLLSGLVKQKP